MLFALVATSAAAQTTSQQCAADIAPPSISLVSGISATTYTDATAVDGATYGYVVTATDMAGNACSNVVGNVTIPSTGTHTVLLNWTASPGSGVTYAVFRAALPTPPSSLAATVN